VRKRMPTAVIETKLQGLNLRWRGKVRDVYDLGENLLIVATDRISAFDCVLGTPIPEKGKLLTQISAAWFRRLEKVSPHHLISTDAKDFPIEARRHLDTVEGRSMLVKKAKRLDVECVVRGYLAGSGWKAYHKTGALFDHALPKGLREAEKLPKPLFTPTTKAEGGAHDEPMTLAELKKAFGPERAAELERVSIAIYEAAAEHSLSRGLILADTKFEFGLIPSAGSGQAELIWIDEALTPDSSRFWEASTWKPGRTPDNFDKQFVRDYLESAGWNKRPPAPALPDEVVRKTAERYAEVLRRVAS
jgi:phosphoribosylaminoimidazole-succinocarboxamide synthase